MINTDSLDPCSSEPIHIPWFIQAHGFTLVIDQDFTITHCSDNLHQAADYLSEALIGRPISLLNILFGKIKDEYFINLHYKLP